MSMLKPRAKWGPIAKWSPSSYIKKGNCASVKKKKESGLVQQPVIQFQDCLDQANSDKGVDFSHFFKTGMALLTSRYEYLHFQKLLQVCESHGSFRAQLRMNPSFYMVAMTTPRPRPET